MISFFWLTAGLQLEAVVATAVVAVMVANSCMSWQNVLPNFGK
jgi:hypothetical protein